MTMIDDSALGRRVLRRDARKFERYDLEGPPQPEMEWLPISFDRASGQGCYLMRMAPGAVTIPHDHPGMEEFMVLEGDLVDSDGTRFGPGDFISYGPNTHHNSWTRTGCVIVVFEWAPLAQQRAAAIRTSDSASDTGSPSA